MDPLEWLVVLGKLPTSTMSCRLFRRASQHLYRHSSGRFRDPMCSAPTLACFASFELRAVLHFENETQLKSPLFHVNLPTHVQLMTEKTPNPKTNSKYQDKNDKCLSCKIIAYGSTIGLTAYSFVNLSRQPLPYSVLLATGSIGLLLLIRRDLR